jgi:hypothetical protein
MTRSALAWGVRACMGRFSLQMRLTTFRDPWLVLKETLRSVSVEVFANGHCQIFPAYQEEDSRHSLRHRHPSVPSRGKREPAAVW